MSPRRRRNAIIKSFFPFFLSLLLALPLLLCAQENLGKGRVSGQVVDENGNPLEGANILVQSLQTQSVLEGVSDKKGHFAVAGMGTGRWKVTATKKGYTSSEINYQVQQLTRNPPIIFTLKKLTGMAALLADEESVKMFDQGNALLKEDKADEALLVFEDFLLKYPDIYQIHLSIGSCYLKKKEWDKAAAEFTLVLEKTKAIFGDYQKDKSTSVRALSGLGEIYLMREDLVKAQEFFKQAVDISPEDEVAAYNVGEVFFSNQQTEEAIHYFELAVKIKKDWPKPYLRLGYVFLNKGDYAKSIEYFSKFVELDPQNPEVPQVKNIIATIEKLRK
ncbi:MAG TPA: tetratricopeptide repeat protein [Acidobacteriota bacterium]